jgi:pimeloyl-ACP methyl ester carboxylesterase
MYRAFPANAQFNAAQRGPNDVPVFLAAGDGSPFAKLVPKMAEGIRANGCNYVETGLIRGSVHYVVEDQPEAVAAKGTGHRQISTLLPIVDLLFQRLKGKASPRGELQ